MEGLQDEVIRLKEELQRSSSEQFFLLKELVTKEMELEKSTLSVEKLKESISSMALESECEIDAVNVNTGNFSQKVEEWLEKKDRSQLNGQSSLSEQEKGSDISKDISVYGEVLGPLLGRLSLALETDADIKEEMQKMSHQMQKYKTLVEKLKEELREEKLKAKEEAEDLAQEMAELRYQVTGLLEEERKHRARIEQASLQRIAELEAQLQREQRKSLFAVRGLPEV
ncbi:sarcolemmal membrane-associated protein-like [Neltuma alba]|uniref:sarcolemmal membrane-associated protein-like n=1 Tax=Neltuma alba TaxID=207710 RepID=UPI0010A2D9D9|nr:sarcolemmal membrane-associated protein-like [Prosopis alba]